MAGPTTPTTDDSKVEWFALEALGLVLRAREPAHRFFRPPAEQPRTVHVHICAHDSVWEREHLLFRDYLRTHPETVATYAELKRHLAQEVGHDRLAYAEGKAAFIRRVIETADLPQQAPDTAG